MSRNVLLVKKVKGNKTNTAFEINKEIKAENVKVESETKQAKKQAKNSSVNNAVKELQKETNDNFLTLLESTNYNTSANITFLNNVIIDLLQAENYKPYKLYKEILSSYETIINEVLNDDDESIHSIDDVIYYSWNRKQLVYALFLAYKKAVNGNHVPSVKNVKSIEYEGQNIYIERIKREHLIRKTYAYVNDTKVENFYYDKNKNTYREIYNKMDLIPYNERITLNTFNECFTRYNEFINAWKSELYTYNENKETYYLNSMLYRLDNESYNKLLQFQRLVIILSYSFVNGIMKAHFEGLKGNKKRDSIKFESLNILDNNGNEIIDTIEDDKPCFDNVILEYNLKSILNDEEYNIFTMLSNKVTQDIICEQLKISKTKISACKKKLYSIFYASIDKSKLLQNNHTSDEINKYAIDNNISYEIAHTLLLSK